MKKPKSKTPRNSNLESRVVGLANILTDFMNKVEQLGRRIRSLENGPANEAESLRGELRLITTERNAALSLAREWERRYKNALKSLEEKDNWRSRALIAEEKLAGSNPSSVESSTAYRELLERATNAERVRDSNFDECQALRDLVKKWSERAVRAESKIEEEKKERLNWERRYKEAEQRVSDCAVACEELRKKSGQRAEEAKESEKYQEGYWHGREIANAFLADHLQRHKDGAWAIRELAELTSSRSVLRPPPGKSTVNELPLRLLVEVVPKKDEKHGTWKHTFKSGVSITVNDENTMPASGYGPAMSVQELPPLPSLETLVGVFFDPERDLKSSIADVLKACGLEVA